jgi:hypothetical protein
VAVVDSSFLVFASDAFPIDPDEDAATNPGIFGRALATFIAAGLRAEGLTPDGPIAEDFGWVLVLPASTGSLIVTCASEDDTARRWHVRIAAEGGVMARLLGRDRRAEDVAALFARIRGILERSDRVSNLREEP